MFLSKHKNRNYYIYFVDVDGKRKSISTKTKYKNLAYKFLSNFQEELKQRLLNKVIPISLNDFTFDYLKYSEVIHAVKTTLSLKATFNALKKYFGNVPLLELTNCNLRNFIEYRLKEVSKFAVNRDIAYLSSSFNWGMGKRYLNENPVKGIKKYKLPEKQPLFFSETEFQKLLLVIEDKDIRNLVVFAVNSGLRQMELLTLRWEQVNFQEQYIVLNNRQHLTKSKKVRTIPLNLTALQILTERQLQIDSEFVFTYQNKPIKQSFISHKSKKLIKKAGLNEALNFHALRSTFATWLIQKQVPLLTVSKLLGHSSPTITAKHYAFLLNSDLKESVNVLDFLN